MRERLYLAGCPTTPLGWMGFGAAMLLGAVTSGGMLMALVVLSWLIKLATAPWAFPLRLLCYLPLWVLLWRAHLPAQPWYQVLPAAALLAGGVAWAQEQRRMEAGPVL